MNNLINWVNKSNNVNFEIVNNSIVDGDESFSFTEFINFYMMPEVADETIDSKMGKIILFHDDVFLVIAEGSVSDWFRHEDYDGYYLFEHSEGYYLTEAYHPYELAEHLFYIGDLDIIPKLVDVYDFISDWVDSSLGVFIYEDLGITSDAEALETAHAIQQASMGASYSADANTEKAGRANDFEATY